MSDLQVRLFGAPRLRRGAALVRTDTRKALALLAVLLLDGPQGRESLAALLWPELDEEHARAALRRTLSPLRRALGKGALEAGRDLVSLSPGASVWADVPAFQSALDELANHHPGGAPLCPACREALETAIGLYADDFMAGFSLRDSAPFDDWQQVQAERLRRALAGALALQTEDDIARGDFAAALAPARRWLALDSLHEEAQRQLMRLFAWSGDRAAALQQYRACVRVLDEELGVPPLPETTALYQQIQANDLPAPPTSPSPHPPTSPTPTPPPLPLVGREPDLAWLRAAYRRVGPDGRFAALTGEAGIGKSRLAAEFIAEVEERGGRALAATCYEGESGLAFAPLIQALQTALATADGPEALAGLPESHWVEASRLAPGLRAWRPALPPAPPLEGPGGQYRFFTGLVETLTFLCAGAAPGVLFLDDAHWADSATLDLLAFLTRRLAQRPVLVLVAWREENRADAPRLRALLAEAERAGSGQRLDLARLDGAAVESLVGAWQARATPTPPPATPAATLGRRILEESEGLPFFVVSYLQTIEPDAAEPSWQLPRNARGFLESRLAGVDETARQLLQTAAVIGRAFDYDLLQAASGRSEEETLAGLEALLRRGLVKEVAGTSAAPRYDFSHERLRSFLYEETSLARQRLLHRRLADALVESARRRGGAGAVAGRVAEQYRLAGQETAAATYHRLAGDHARALGANREALTHYQMALALGLPDAGGLHLASGDLQVLLGQYEAAHHSYEAAAAVSEGERRAELEHRLGRLALREGAYERAARQFALAEATAGEAAAGDPGWQARLQADWSLAAFRQGAPAEAQARADRALALAEAAGEPVARAGAHNLLGILARARGDLAAAREYLEQSRALAEEAGLAEARVAALNNLALLEGDVDAHARARERLEEALALCLSLGDRHQEAALRSNLADVLHRLGEEGEALEQLKQSVAISAEIGGDEATSLPEIWKLTEW